MRRVFFINRFYWPEEPATSQLLTDLAQAVAAAGLSVSVITSRRDRRASRRETHQGVKVIRVGFVRHDGRAAIFRIIDFVGFMLAALWRLWREVHGGDTVVIMTDPPLLGALAAPLLDWRDARIIHWVQDIYPEVAVALTGQRWLNILRPWRNHAWRRADACVTIGHDMAGVLSRTGMGASRLTIIPNWAPRGLTEASPQAVEFTKRAWGVADKFVVLYSGNLGRVHDLEPVLDVAAELRAVPEIAFVFVGSGAQQRILQAAASERHLTNVTFRPPESRANLSASLSAGDLHWVTLKPGCETCVLPSKFHGIMAVARPVLFLGPTNSELFRSISESNLGLSFSRNQTIAAAQAIITLRHDRALYHDLCESARRHAAAHGLAQATTEWLKLLGQRSTLAAL